MYKNNYEVNVLVNGRPVKEYYHKGKFYIEARENTEYSIKIKNHSYNRIMAVVSIDGIDVLKGQNASEAESGYIINGYSSTEIKGYRIDNDNVANFKFDDGKKSYSTQIENKFNPKEIAKVAKGIKAPCKNNGVIGVRIWEEKETKLIPDWDNTDIINAKSLNSFSNFAWSGSIATSTPSSTISVSGIGLSDSMTTGCMIYNHMRSAVNQFGELKAVNCIINNDTVTAQRRAIFRAELVDTPRQYIPKFDLGTTWGDKQEDKIMKVEFERTDYYLDIEIFYLKRQELINLGIDLDNAKKIFVSGYPKAFDKREDYCPMPLNWRKR